MISESSDSESSSSDQVELEMLFVLLRAAQELNDQLQATPRSKRARNYARGPSTFDTDYLSPEPTYPPLDFRRRFRVSIELFHRLVAECEEDPFFAPKYDITLKEGIPSRIKVSINSLIEDRCCLAVPWSGRVCRWSGPLLPL